MPSIKDASSENIFPTVFCMHVLCHKGEVHVHSFYTLSCIYRLPLKITNKSNRNFFAPPLHQPPWIFAVLVVVLL